MASTTARRLSIVLSLTGSTLIVEIVAGIASGSLALLADAGHMFADVGAIALSLTAMQLAARPATDTRTFGLYRLEILAALLNAVLLTGTAGLVIFEAVRRFGSPPDVSGRLMLGAAVAGLVVNAVSLRLLHDAQHHNLNVRSAYLEVLGDLLGSLAVVVAAIFIAAGGSRRADIIASIAVGLMILPRTWHLLKETVGILLEASPKGLDTKEVRRHILEADGVADVHDLHAWTITSGLPVVSAHVVLKPGADAAAVLESLSACLADDFDIDHSTFQLETFDRRRFEQSGHA